MTNDQFNRQLQNLTGYFMLARRLRDHLVERQASGNVVMLGSMYGVVGSYPMFTPDWSPLVRPPITRSREVLFT